MKRGIVVLSGGQDSVTCLAKALALGWEVFALTIDYGQRHSAEIEAAKTVVKLFKHWYPDQMLEHEILELGSSVLQGTSPLVSDSPLEQYESHAVLPGGLEKTFVPLRNQLFLTLAANRAYVHNCSAVITGVSQEDFGGYPDCRRPFIQALQDATKEAAFNDTTGLPNFEFITPLLDLSKRQTVELAMNTRHAYGALAFSHTSYDGAYPPTGHDHATLLRAKGFEEAMVPDPLVLRAWLDGEMSLPNSPNYQQGITNYVSVVHSVCDLLGGL